MIPIQNAPYSKIPGFPIMTAAFFLPKEATFSSGAQHTNFYGSATSESVRLLPSSESGGIRAENEHSDNSVPQIRQNLQILCI